MENFVDASKPIVKISVDMVGVPHVNICAHKISAFDFGISVKENFSFQPRVDEEVPDWVILGGGAGFLFLLYRWVSGIGINGSGWGTESAVVEDMLPVSSLIGEETASAPQPEAKPKKQKTAVDQETEFIGYKYPFRKPTKPKSRKIMKGLPPPVEKAVVVYGGVQKAKKEIRNSLLKGFFGGNGDVVDGEIINK